MFIIVCCLLCIPVYVYFSEFLEENKLKDITILRLNLRLNNVKEKDEESILEEYLGRKYNDVQKKMKEDLYLKESKERAESILKEYKESKIRAFYYKPKKTMRDILIFIILCFCVFNYLLYYTNGEIEEKDNTIFYPRYIK